MTTDPKSNNSFDGELPDFQSVAQHEVMDQIIGHRLKQYDIDRILQSLDTADREQFTEKLADVLRKTSALLEVARRVTDTLELDVVLQRMVEIVSEFLNADRCTLFLHDTDTHELYSRVVKGGGFDEIRFPAHLGIAGTVFTTHEPLMIHDAYADARFNQEIDRKTGYRTRNILCAPITTSGDRIIGVAQVLNKKEGDFNSDDLGLLQAITSQAAGAFVNAQLHEQISRAQREEAQLLEVTTAISRELKLDALLAKIMQTVTTILTADRSTLFMHDARTHELWSHVAQGEGIAEIRFPSHLGIAGSVFTAGETVNIPDAYADPRFNQDIDRKTGYRTQNILCMPVINKQGVTIGVIQVLNKRGGPFTGIDERRLRAFSSQASIAIENAQLFEDVMTVKNYNESVLQSMKSGVITLDAHGAIATANQAALRMLRREDRPQSLIAMRAEAFFHGQNSWIAESINNVEKHGEPDIALDVSLHLADLHGADPALLKASAGDEDANQVSVNLSVVQLTSIKNEHLGSIMMLEDITNEKRLKGTMARYMTKEVADKLLEEGEGALGGQIQTVSVLFTDIRSFTSITERLGAQETVSMLNEYFSIMVDIILENSGILDKYIGDACMAVFGAPFPTDQDADNAVRTTIEMLKALNIFNAQRLRAGKEPVRMGLGVNTDEVLSGNIGSLKRMDYTVIGDGVNLASRLEGANKPYGTEILISEMTVRALKHSYKMREVDKIRVKGKTEPVGVYQVVEAYDETQFPNMDAVLETFAQGLRYYRNQSWNAAKQAFEYVLTLHPKDSCSILYVERCEHFLAQPPPSDWDGVWTMTEK